MNNPFDAIDARLSKIENLLLDLKHSQKDKDSKPDSDSWFDLNELVKYDPEKRTKATFYGYIHTKEIPFHKRGKKLIFLKSEIDLWLKAGRKKTASEIGKEADAFLNNRKAKK